MARVFNAKGDIGDELVYSLISFVFSVMIFLVALHLGGMKRLEGEKPTIVE